MLFLVNMTNYEHVKRKSSERGSWGKESINDSDLSDSLSRGSSVIVRDRPELRFDLDGGGTRSALGSQRTVRMMLVVLFLFE